MEENQVIIYVLEKCEDFVDGWDEIEWFTESNLDQAEDEYETLENHGYGNYRLRKVTIYKNRGWDWVLHKHNFEANESKD